MALGVLTRVANTTTVVGNKKMRVYDVQLSSGANYPTGGDTITPAAVGFGRRIEEAMPTGIARATTGGATSRTVSFDYATTPGSVKMQVNTTASAEAANNSDQSAFSVRVAFIGV
jgi:hypothetical protein